jgi:hypothetical protein
MLRQQLRRDRAANGAGYSKPQGASSHLLVWRRQNCTPQQPPGGERRLGFWNPAVHQRDILNTIATEKVYSSGEYGSALSRIRSTRTPNGLSHPLVIASHLRHFRVLFLSSPNGDDSHPTIV